MDVPSIIEFVLLPAIGWLLLNSNKTQQRLTRIETLLKNLGKNKHHED